MANKNQAFGFLFPSLLIFTTKRTSLNIRKNFFTEGAVRPWKEVPREVSKEHLDVMAEKRGSDKTHTHLEIFYGEPSWPSKVAQELLQMKTVIVVGPGSQETTYAPGWMLKPALVFTPGGILRSEFIRKGLLESRDKKKRRSYLSASKG